MRTSAMANVQERIEKVISENPVVLFMKGTPEFPQCGFSSQVVQILEYVGAPIASVNVLEDAEIRQGIKEYANWPTVPQLYIKGEFVGGCDIVREMFQSGELTSVLTDAGVPVKSTAGA
jgi:monothiol glutaredoxin